MLYSADRPQFYYSVDEGATWTVQRLTPSNINPRSLVWNSVDFGMALAHDSIGNRVLYSYKLLCHLSHTPFVINSSMLLKTWEGPGARLLTTLHPLLITSGKLNVLLVKPDRP